jgi:hypothetical protein
VDVLFLCLGATLFHDCAALEHGAEADTSRRDVVSARVALLVLLVVDLVGCATTSTHQFAQPGADWQTRTGQLMYRNATTTVIGDVIVRNSKAGDFELTFSKGPGVNLLVLRQDANFAEINGPMAQRGWSGPIETAPQQLRGWLGLRGAITRSKDRHLVRHVAGPETFVFRF